MTPAKKEALRLASMGVNSVKHELSRIYDRLASAGCEREAESLRNVCRILEDRQASWARRREGR
jgi:hypothetical protein